MSSSVQHVVDAEELVDPAPKPVRRSFTTEYRHRVVAEYEAAPHGEKTGVLRREGLYQSQVREWRAERDAKGGRFGPAPQFASGLAEIVGFGTDRLRAENARLTKDLAKSQAVVEIMGKLQGLLETISESTDTPPPPTTR